ncbi:hypothetical protein BT69DRAFT_1295673 [Atractiella rhizophila]|nr:hypothetical protein BT69DRAFT_1295673 [Atractiella rhizophila]
MGVAHVEFYVGTQGCYARSDADLSLRETTGVKAMVRLTRLTVGEEENDEGGKMVIYEYKDENEDFSRTKKGIGLPARFLLKRPAIITPVRADDDNGEFYRGTDLNLLLSRMMANENDFREYKNWRATFDATTLSYIVKEEVISPKKIEEGVGKKTFKKQDIEALTTVPWSGDGIDGVRNLSGVHRTSQTGFKHRHLVPVCPLHPDNLKPTASIHVRSKQYPSSQNIWKCPIKDCGLETWLYMGKLHFDHEHSEEQKTNLSSADRVELECVNAEDIKKVLEWGRKDVEKQEDFKRKQAENGLK